MTNIRRLALAAALCGTSMLLAPPAAHAADGQVRTVLSTKLPNLPGKSLTAVVVTYGPGGATPAHRHPGSVFAYVLSGSIRSESSATGPAQVYHAGQSFFEPPGSTHLISENASKTEPASLLAIIIANTGAPLVMPAGK